MIGGRGAGKTRAGAEWVRAQAMGRAPLASEKAGRIALVGETENDVREVMIEGVSGLMEIQGTSVRSGFPRRDARWHWRDSRAATGWLITAARMRRWPKPVQAPAAGRALWHGRGVRWHSFRFPSVRRQPVRARRSA